MRRSHLLKLVDIDDTTFKNRLKQDLLPIEVSTPEAAGRRRDYEPSDVLALAMSVALVGGGMPVADAKAAVLRVSHYELQHWWPAVVEPSCPPVFLGVATFVPNKGRGAGRETTAQFLGLIGSLSGMTRTTNRCCLEDLLPNTICCNLVNMNAVVAQIRARATEHCINLDIDALYAVEPETFNEFYSVADRKARDALIEKAKTGCRGS